MTCGTISEVHHRSAVSSGYLPNGSWTALDNVIDAGGEH